MPRKRSATSAGCCTKSRSASCWKRTFPPAATSRSAAVVDFVERELTREELRSCIRELPPRYREVLRLKYFENCTSEQIGRAMGLPANQVRVLLTRARTPAETESTPAPHPRRGGGRRTAPSSAQPGRACSRAPLRGSRTRHQAPQGGGLRGISAAFPFGLFEPLSEYVKF